MVLRIALAALAIAGCSGPAPTPATPEPSADRVHPWPMFRGRPTHVGDAGDRPTPAWTPGWSVELGERIDASPLIAAGGRVVVATREGTVVALDLTTGAERARANVGAGVWSTPALAGDVLVVASADARLHGLRASDLTELWTRTAPDRSFSGITVAGGAAYLCSGTRLLVLDPASGRIHVSVELGASSFTAPAVDLDRRLVVVGTRGGDVLAFDLMGKPRWMAQTTPGAHNDGSPVIAGDLVLIGSNDQGLHAFSAADGAPRWNLEGEAWVVSTPAVTGSAIFVGDDGGNLRAVDTAGQLQWTTRVGRDLASSPTVVGELVVHGAHDGRVHAHRRDGSGSRPSIDAGAPIYASPAVTMSGDVVIATHAGRVLLIE